MGCVLLFWCTSCANLLGPCETEVRARVNSPDGKWTAISSVVNCGATVAFSAEVSVVPSDWKMPDDAHIVYVGYHSDESVKCRWTDSKHLEIQKAEGAETHQDVAKLDVVIITYK